jgi:hypothetical protein
MLLTTSRRDGTPVSTPVTAKYGFITKITEALGTIGGTRRRPDAGSARRQSEA